MFESNVDHKNRTIYLGGMIDEHSARDVIQGILVLSRKNSKQPIRLVINSSGGCSDNGYAIYGAIRNSPSQVIGTVYGIAHSAAAIIFQACDKRFMDQHSVTMIHNGTVSQRPTDPHEFMKVGKDGVRDIQKMHRIFSERSGLPLRKIRAMCRHSTYLSAEDALKLNFADGILVPQKLFPR